MNAHETQELHHEFSQLRAELGALRDLMAQNFVNGEVERFRFDGKKGPIEVVDDHGSNALAYAVYNPNEFRVFVGLAGLGANADGLIIPKQKLVVAPITINGHVQLAADAAQLAEGAGTILRWRFPTPQPFFVGALA